MSLRNFITRPKPNLNTRQKVAGDEKIDDKNPSESATLSSNDGGDGTTELSSRDSTNQNVIPTSTKNPIRLKSRPKPTIKALSRPNKTSKVEVVTTKASTNLNKPQQTNAAAGNSKSVEEAATEKLSKIENGKLPNEKIGTEIAPELVLKTNISKNATITNERNTGTSATQINDVSATTSKPRNKTTVNNARQETSDAGRTSRSTEVESMGTATKSSSELLIAERQKKKVVAGTLNHPVFKHLPPEILKGLTVPNLKKKINSLIGGKISSVEDSAVRVNSEDVKLSSNTIEKTQERIDDCSVVDLSGYHPKKVTTNNLQVTRKRKLSSSVQPVTDSSYLDQQTEVVNDNIQCGEISETRPAELDNGNTKECPNLEKETILQQAAVTKKKKDFSSFRRINWAKPNFTPVRQIQHQTTSSYSQMNTAAKKRLKDKFGAAFPEHSKLTMQDLIFYNPPTNPMPAENKEGEDEVVINIETISEPPVDQYLNTQLDKINQESVNTTKKSTAIDSNGLPVPQLKVTADGRVIIAPESLVVTAKKDNENLESRPIIYENELTQHKVKSPRSKKHWTFQETLKFYKELHRTGSDFSTMAYSLPGRTRTCVKRKFKREERINQHLIDKVIGARSNQINFKDIEKELAVDEMWNQIEKSFKKQSEFIPDIPDISEGVTDDMFLTKLEIKTLKKKNVANTNDHGKKEISDIRTAMFKNQLLSKKKVIHGRSNNLHRISEFISSSSKSNLKPNKAVNRKKPKIIKLQHYLANNPPSSLQEITSRANSSIENKSGTARGIQQHHESQEIVISDDEDMNVKSVTDSPIVVNTRIESTGIKYTKSVTINPSNLENPIDINETIAHPSEPEERYSCSNIINEITDILSMDEDSGPDVWIS